MKLKLILYAVACIGFLSCNEKETSEGDSPGQGQVDSVWANARFFREFDIEKLEPKKMLGERPDNTPYVKAEYLDDQIERILFYSGSSELIFVRDGDHYVRRDSAVIQGSSVYAVEFLIPGATIVYGYDINPWLTDTTPSRWTKVISTLGEEIRLEATSFTDSISHPYPDLNIPEYDWFRKRRTTYILKESILVETMIDSMKKEGALTFNWEKTKCYDVSKGSLFWRIFFSKTGEQLESCDGS